MTTPEPAQGQVPTPPGCFACGGDPNLCDCGGEGSEPAQSHLLIYGNPVDGFTYIGPVTPNDPDLDSFIDTELRGTEWWLAPMQELAAAVEEASNGT